jgi:hypothetical protein
VILPPKRARRDPSGGNGGAADGEGGLRIGTGMSAHSPARVAPDLEVREFHGNVVRLEPEEPDTERMPRHRVFHEKSSARDEFALSGEAREWGRSKKQPVLMILATGLGLITLVAGTIMALPYINKSNAARPGDGEPDLVVEKITEGVAMADMLSRKEEAVRVFRAFLAASSVEAMLPLVRNPGEVAGPIGTDKRLPQVGPESTELRIAAWKVRENESLTYGILTGTLPDFSRFQSCFTVTDGRLVMDWKASTAYGTADFPQLMREQGDATEIRGWLEPAEFYTAAFPENAYQTYQLASPDKELAIWIYARRGSGIHGRLRTLIKGGYILEGREDAQKVTVRLSPGPDDALPGQWEIVELLHKEWIAP